MAQADDDDAATPTSSALLGDRQFCADLAKLAEQIVMDDMAPGYFPEEVPEGAQVEACIAHHMDHKLCCREGAWVIPEKLGSHPRRAVKRGAPRSTNRKRHLLDYFRATWAIELQQRYDAEVVEWIDTGEGCEKAVVLLRLRRHCPGGRPVLVVAWRGSKTARDYMVTDMSPRMVPLPWGAMFAAAGSGSVPLDDDVTTTSATGSTDADQAAKRLMFRRSVLPCSTYGLWRAYAGSAARAINELGPRGRVRKCIERCLAEEPSLQLCMCGHSLGGALATLNAVDLLLTMPQCRTGGITMVG